MNDSLFNLSGKVAVVTGGSRGIGRAISIGLARAGADVVATSRNFEKVKEVTEEIIKLGRQSMAITTDVAKKMEIERLANEVNKKFGKIDVLINNAGVNPIYKYAEYVTEEEWDNIVNVNMKGLFFCCQSFGKKMIEQKFGKIINISSINGLAGTARAVPYCSTKGAVIIMTKCLAMDWASHNIQVNSIAPGFINTDLTSDLKKNQYIMDKLLSHIPQKRFGNPEEIVGAALLLSSEMSSYITGQTIFIDGGFTAM